MVVEKHASLRQPKYILNVQVHNNVEHNFLRQTVHLASLNNANSTTHTAQTKHCFGFDADRSKWLPSIHEHHCNISTTPALAFWGIRRASFLFSHAHTLTRSHAHTLTLFSGKKNTERNTDTDTHRHTHTHTYRHTHTQRHRDTYRQTHIQTDKQKGKHGLQVFAGAADECAEVVLD